ncbi:MAG: nucleotidyltransferase [Hyphomicrobium sp.]
MAISKEQLNTWAKQGPTAQFTATYEGLRTYLNDSSSPYYPKDFNVFLQGSYKNDTNVYGDSDVDVVIQLNQTYYEDISSLPEEQKQAWKAARSDAVYTLDQFKRDVTDWLVKKYGSDVQPGTKAIYIKGKGNRRNADVLICCQHHRYTRFKSFSDQNYHEGVSFTNSSGIRIDNFPKQHSDNCTTKHQASKNWFKPTARIYKNLRNTMIEKKLIEDGLAPSYFIEGLLWNVPVDRFGGTEQQNFIDTLDWLSKADRSKFVCANDLYYLFHPTSLVTWRAEKCEEFLRKAIQYWNAA